MMPQREVQLSRMALALRMADLLPGPNAETDEVVAAAKARQEAAVAYSAAQKRYDAALEALWPIIAPLYQQLKAAA